MSAGIDRLIAARKAGVFDDIDLAIEQAREAITTNWTLFDSREAGRLLEAEALLLEARRAFRRELKEAHRA